MWTGIRTGIDYVYIWRCLCVSLTCKFPPKLTCVLTIGDLICCLTIHYSGSEGPEIRKRRKLDLKGSGVSHKKKVGEEDEYDVTRKDNKS